MAFRKWINFVKNGDKDLGPDRFIYETDVQKTFAMQKLKLILNRA